MREIMSHNPKSALRAYSDALNREAHNLARFPDLMWQQVYNRLRWQVGTVDGLDELLGRGQTARTAVGNTRWMQTRAPFRESDELIRTLIGHTGGIAACSFSPDGAYVVSASGSTLKLWDSATGRELRTLTGHTGLVTGCAVSPDGAYVVSASWDGTLKLWDPATGKELRTLVDDADFEVLGCAVSPDGAHIVSAGRYYARLWDVDSWDDIHVMAGHYDQYHSLVAVWDCAFSPDGCYFVSASQDTTLKLWDPATEQEIRTLTGHTRAVTACAISPDGTYVLSASYDGTLKLWDPTTGREIRTLTGHEGEVLGCAVSPDGAFVSSASADGTLKLWDPATGQELCSLTGHAGEVIGCAISPDGTRVVSSGNDRTLKIWDPSKAAKSEAAASDGGALSDLMCTACSFSSDGASVACATGGSLTLCDPATGQQVRKLTTRESLVVDCAVSPEDTFIVSAGRDGRLRLWDPGTGEELLRAPAAGTASPSERKRWWLSAERRTHPQPVELAVGDTVLHPEHGQGKVLNKAVKEILGARREYLTMKFVQDDITLMVPTDGSAQEVRRVTEDTLAGHAQPVWGCAISPDGAYIVSASADKTMKLWDPSTCRQLATLAGHDGEVFDCAVSPDGTYVVSASEDRTLMLWSPTTGLPLRVFTGHSAQVGSCAVSPDGASVLSGSYDGTVKLWDVTSGQEIWTLTGHAGAVTGCAISPDGVYAISAGEDDDSLRIWDRTSGSQAAIIMLPTGLRGVSPHPWQPLVACGGMAGAPYLLDLIGLDYGPIIVTARRSGDGLVVLCPRCRQHQSIRDWQLGHGLTCPTRECGLRLKVNSFVLDV